MVATTFPTEIALQPPTMGNTACMPRQLKLTDEDIKFLQENTEMNTEDIKVMKCIFNYPYNTIFFDLPSFSHMEKLTAFAACCLKLLTHIRVAQLTSGDTKH